MSQSVHIRRPLATLRFRIETPAAPAAVLRGLGAPASWTLAESVVDFLGPAYEVAGALARRLALAPEEPSQPRPDDGRTEPPPRGPRS